MNTALIDLLMILPILLAARWLFKEDTAEDLWDKKAGLMKYEHDFH